MSLLQPFTAKVNAIEPITAEDAADSGLPAAISGYQSIHDPVQFEHFQTLHVITAQIGDAKVEKFLIHNDIMTLEEEDTIKIVYCGGDLAGILNLKDGLYAYNMPPLQKKFALPHALSGLKSGIICIIGGYILNLMAMQSNASIMSVFFQLAFLLMALGCFAYAGYSYTNQSLTRNKMRRYMQKIAVLPDTSHQQ